MSRTNQWFTVGVLVVLAAAARTIGCSQSATEAQIQLQTVTNLPSEGDPRLLTIEHDGHKFVLWTSHVNSGNAGSLIHHPGCHCLKTAERTP